MSIINKITRIEQAVEVDETLKERSTHGSFELPIETYMDNCVIYHSLYTHWHEEMEIIYIEKGSGFARLNAETFRIKKGDLLFINCNVVHNIKTDVMNTLYYKSIVFHPNFLLGQAGDRFQERVVAPLMENRLGITPLITPADLHYGQICGLFTQIYNCYSLKEPYYYVLLKSLFYSLFYEMMTDNYIIPSTPEQTKNLLVIRDVLDYISQHYQEPLRAEELTARTNYSESYFMKIFKHYTGKTLISYINDYRLEQAKSLLLYTDNSVTEIALQVGFNSTSYFIKKFQEANHISPYKFKRASGEHSEWLEQSGL